VYARHVGLDVLLPINEPLGTYGFAVLGGALFVLRHQRRQLTRQHVRVQSEMDAMQRVRPLFTHAGQELEAEIDQLTSSLDITHVVEAARYSPAVARALGRLDELRGRLRDMLGAETVSEPVEAERQLLARDSQFGALLLVSIAVVVALPTAMWSYRWIGASLTQLYSVKFVFDLGLVAYLLGTRRSPSSPRAFWVVFLFIGTWLPVIDYAQHQLLAAHRPFVPFLGHKLLMGMLGVTLTTRVRPAVVLIIAIAASALAAWFILDMGAHHDIIAIAEPSVVLVYMAIGLISLRLVEQRQLASIQLLRDETAAAAMQRRTKLFLAVRDRLNSPLQTLVLAASEATPQLPDDQSNRVGRAIDRLVCLSRELAELELPQSTSWASLDSNEELRRHL
jgi:hypothetical protein